MKALLPITSVGQYFQSKNSVLTNEFYTVAGEKVSSLGLSLVVSTGGSGGAGGLAEGGNAGKSANLDQSNYYLSVSPNPFTSELSFDFVLPENDKVRLSIFDNMGRIVSQEDKMFSRGFNSMKMDVSEQSKGFYWYTFECGGQVQSGKIIKQ